MCIGLNFSLLKKGSNSAVITGNVNNDSMPIATFDAFRDKKYVIQCAPKNIALIRNGIRFFCGSFLNSIFWNLQNKNKANIPKEDLNQIITEVGMSIYFPRAPEVLMKSADNTNMDKFLTCEFSISNCL